MNKRKGMGKSPAVQKQTQVASPVQPSKSIAHALLLGCIVLLISAIFAYTVVIRHPWFGTLSRDHHQWLTGSTLKFSKNWYREGAFHLRYLMLENPRSVEFPTLKSRIVYCSYPPGTILPIYAISRITRTEPNAAMVMTYNLANQLLLALVLAFTVYFTLIRVLHRIYAALLSIIPPLIVLLMPAPMYWFQNVYFSDQAIILPYALLLFTEVIQDNVLNSRQQRLLDLCQALILFCGFFTDWLFVFLSLFVYAKRILLGQVTLPWRTFFTRSLYFWGGPFLALGLFAWQLTAFQSWGKLFERYLTRTGINAEGQREVESFFARFWHGHIQQGYGELAIYLLWGSLLLLCVAIMRLWIVRKAPNWRLACELPMLSLICLALLPIFLEIYTFNNHSWVHDFSALKMVIPLSLVPFVLLPVWLLLIAKRIPNIDEMRPRFMPVLTVSTMLLLGVTLAYTLHEHPRYSAFFPAPLKALPRVAEIFQNNYSYNDIVVSRNFEIPINPPQLLAYSMKRVYLVSSPADIAKITAGIHEPYTIRPLTLESRGRDH